MNDWNEELVYRWLNLETATEVWVEIKVTVVWVERADIVISVVSVIFTIRSEIILNVVVVILVCVAFWVSLNSEVRNW